MNGFTSLVSFLCVVYSTGELQGFEHSHKMWIKPVNYLPLDNCHYSLCCQVSSNTHTYCYSRIACHNAFRQSLLALLISNFRVKSELPKVHRQLALSLLLTEVVFLIGVDRQAVPSPDGLCTTFAALLHYLLLVTFAWMLIEGVHMFVKLVLAYYSKKIYIVYYFLAWGIPIIIVAISLGANLCVYGSTA